jgi:transposase-like protein
LVEDHLDEFLAVYDDRFAATHGPLRAVIPEAAERLLKCGILDYGFARIRCPECGDEFLLAHSCKSRCLCPSCRKMRQVEFGEWAATELLEAVPHRHIVLSVPRRLRLLFRRDRSRRVKLARAAWETVKEFLQVAAGEKDAVAGGDACIQTYGNLLDWHPHAHLLVSWGVFRPDGSFVPVTDVPPKQRIEKLFRHKILPMLKQEGAIDDAVIENLLSWPNTGFSAHVSLDIAATDAATRENVARYLCHPPIVLGRIMAQDSAAGVVYMSDSVHPRHGANFRVFDPLEFIAEIVAHIPDSYEKVATEYGWHSNRTRRIRKEHGLLKPDPPAKDPVADSDKASIDTFRAWARLIAKVYEVNPLTCPQCGSEMKVVAVIDREDAIYRILRHLGLLAPEESRAPPVAASAAPPPPPQATPHDLFSSTALFADAPFSELPAWDLPDPPGPDHASQPDSDLGDHIDDRDDGPDPEAEDIA